MNTSVIIAVVDVDNKSRMMAVDVLRGLSTLSNHNLFVVGRLSTLLIYILLLLLSTAPSFTRSQSMISRTTF